VWWKEIFAGVANKTDLEGHRMPGVILHKAFAFDLVIARTRHDLHTHGGQARREKERERRDSGRRAVEGSER
jgi:hypothetical protein